MGKPVQEKIKTRMKIIQADVESATDVTYEKALKNLHAWVVEITERRAPEDPKQLEAVVRAVNELYKFENKLRGKGSNEEEEEE